MTTVILGPFCAELNACGDCCDLDDNCDPITSSSSGGSSSSSGSGSSSSGGTGILTDCCGNRIPETLYLNIDSTSGGDSTCSCLDGDYSLVYDSGTGKWSTTISNPCGEGDTTVDLWCVGGTGGSGWFLDIACTTDDPPSFELPGANVQCDPFLIEYGASFGLCCDGLLPRGTNITITE
jgi:hypothetical protein